jgi:hypothetical protein
MGESQSQRRMAENEVVFRTYNERVKQNFDEIIKVAKESNQDYLVKTDDTALHFYCECSDENCRQRILLKPSEYNRIHKNRRRFVLVYGHETSVIENIIRREDNYCVVEKHIKPPETSRTLNPTGVNNT